MLSLPFNLYGLKLLIFGKNRKYGILLLVISYLFIVVNINAYYSLKTPDLNEEMIDWCRKNSWGITDSESVLKPANN